MIEISYAVALCVLGGLAWDAWRRRLVVEASRIRSLESIDLMEKRFERNIRTIEDQVRSLEHEAKAEVKGLHDRVRVVHEDVVTLTQHTKAQFDNLSGKRSLQSVIGQPVPGSVPF